MIDGNEISLIVVEPALNDATVLNSDIIRNPIANKNPNVNNHFQKSGKYIPSIKSINDYS